MTDVMLSVRTNTFGQPYNRVAPTNNRPNVRSSARKEFQPQNGYHHLHKRADQLSTRPERSHKNLANHGSGAPTLSNNSNKISTNQRGVAVRSTKVMADKKIAKYPLAAVTQSGTNGPSEATPTTVISGQSKQSYCERRRHPSGLLRAAKSETNLKQTSQSMMNAQNSLLSDEDIYQIWLMFSGRATKVIVCSCLANLYLSKRSSKQNSPKKSDWELVATGAPVLMLNYGESRIRTVRQIQVVLAEKGTGFALWKDIIDSLTQYKEVGKTFHTMLLSDNHQMMAGLSFDNAYSAMKFYAQIHQLTSDPENTCLSPKKYQQENKSRRHSFSGSAKKVTLKKSEISNPCCFSHVTCLKPHHLSADFPLSRELGPKRAQSCLQIPGDTNISPSQSV